MQKILISKCLLGDKVNYLGKDSLCRHPLIKQWQDEGRFVSVCPEVQGGATIPRPACQIVGAGGGEAVLNKLAYIKTEQGEDFTNLYIKGAEIALKIAKQHNIKIAILKERSPSCGSTHIYDGSFSAKKIPGVGVTAALLRKNNIQVFSDEQIDEAANYLNFLESQ